MSNTIKLTNAPLQANAIKLTNTPLQNVSIKNANGVVVGATDHSKLTNRDLADQHPISAITGLQEELDSLMQGVVYTPSVSSSGVISWTNNGGLANPTPVNIKGVKGDKGEQGIQGVQGEQGVSGVYVGTGDMPIGYNVQIDPSGTTVEYATKAELNTRLEVKTGYHHKINTYYEQGLYLIGIDYEYYKQNHYIVPINFQPYYLLVTGKCGSISFGDLPNGAVGHPVQYVFDGDVIKMREVTSVNSDNGTVTWSSWTKHATKADIDAEAQARETADNALSAQIRDVDTALDIQNELINTSKDFLKIAYSSLVMGGINNAIHWLYATQMGFNALKGDVELTSDGELIMCHDTGFTFDTNGDIITFKSSNNTPINTLTHEQCMGLKYSPQLSIYGEYVYVADIDDFLKICKDKNKIAFITVRDRNTSADIDTYVKPVVDKLYDKLDFYGLKDRCIINHVNTSGSTACLARPLDYIRNTLNDKSIKLNFVYNSSKAITNTVVDFVKALGNCYLSVWCNDSKTVIDNSESSIAYAKSNGVKLLACIIGTQSLYQYVIAKGFSGCQITKEIFDSEPQIIRFVINVTNGVLTFKNISSLADKYTADITTFSDATYTYLCIGNIRKNGSYLTRTRIINDESTECSYCDAVIPIMMNTLYPIINCRRDGYGTEVTADWVKTSTISDTKPYYGYIRIKIKGNDINNLSGNYPVSIVI